MRLAKNESRQFGTMFEALVVVRPVESERSEERNVSRTIPGAARRGRPNKCHFEFQIILPSLDGHGAPMVPFRVF